MRFGWLIAAAAMVCAVPAGAATFVEYEVTGTGVSTYPFGPPGLATTSGFNYQFILEVDPGYSDPSHNSVGTGSTYFYSATADTTSGQGRYLSASITSPGTLQVAVASNPSGALPTSFTLNFATMGNPNLFPTSLSSNMASGSFFGDFAGRGSGSVLNGNITGFYVLGTVAGFAFEPAAGAIPEPASWAMMILGMGAIGYAMRSAKRRVSTRLSY